MNDDKYYLVIDTDTYADNFERELCAYITGVIGDCRVGSKMAKKAKKELDAATIDYFENFVEREADDHGCYRPVQIWPNPRYFDDGQGNHYLINDYDPIKVIERHDQSVHEEARRIEQIYADKDYAKQQAQRYLDRYLYKSTAENLDPAQLHPAYNSVAIGLEEKPSLTIIELIKARARAYSQMPHEFFGTFNIEGFRWVTVRTVDESEDL